MRKASLRAAALIGVLAAAPLLRAQAGDAGSTQAAAPAAAPAPQTANAAAPAKPAKPRCARTQDANTPPRKGACFSNLGSSYSGDELNATGATNPGDALHLVDPSVTVRH
jgi:hypothetical protein